MNSGNIIFGYIVVIRYYKKVWFVTIRGMVCYTGYLNFNLKNIYSGWFFYQRTLIIPKNKYIFTTLYPYRFLEFLLLLMTICIYGIYKSKIL